MPKMIALFRGELRGICRSVVVRREEESASAGSRIDHGVIDRRQHAVDHRLNEWTGREVLPGAGFDVGAGRRPVFLVDEVDDEPFQFGRILDAVLGLSEDRAQGSRLGRKISEDMSVGDLEIVAIGVQESLPGAFRRNDCLGVERAVFPFVCDLQEQ